MTTIETVENAFFKRMLGHAFVGFLKAGAIAAVIGAALGASLVSAGLLIPATAYLGSHVLAGAVIGALFCMLPAGAFGATAGINSVRDARAVWLQEKASTSTKQLVKEVDKIETALEISGEKVQPSEPLTRHWLDKVQSAQGIQEHSLGKS